MRAVVIQTAMKSFTSFAAAALLFSAIPFAAAHQSTPSPWNGPTFREFSGVNQGNPKSVLAPCIGWDRPTFFSDGAEPSKGIWNHKYISDYQAQVLADRRVGIRCLTILGYMPNWAGPNPHGPPTNVADWTDYVTRIVHDLHAAPYNENYFQIWNEATPRGGAFYVGSFDDYMNKIQIPAGKAIHDAGCKVVWGGWPGGLVSAWDFINMMSKYSAWDSIDVVDLHYFNWTDLKIIHDYAVAHGHTNLGYWQTEVGFTTDPLAIPTKYIGALQWALTSGVWNARDRFKYFYFAEWAPDDPAVASYHRCLLTGDKLNFHGLILQNMARLLGGGRLAALTGVTGSGLGNGSSIAAFKVGSATDVIAVQMSAADYGSGGVKTLTIPISRAGITKAERIDLDGSHVVDITWSLVAYGSRTEVTASTQDAAGSNAAKWNGTVMGDKPGWDNAVFYVRLTRGSYLHRQHVK